MLLSCVSASVYRHLQVCLLNLQEAVKRCETAEQKSVQRLRDVAVFHTLSAQPTKTELLSLALTISLSLFVSLPRLLSLSFCPSKNV